MTRRWLARVLRRIREMAASGRVLITLKALQELDALDLGLDVEDVCDVLRTLTSNDFDGRVVSERTLEWMYVFKPKLSGTTVYLKLALRSNCVIVSFHEEGEGS